MNFSMYTASVPLITQMLGSLSSVLTKAQQHAEAKKIEPAALLQARLFPDMLSLSRQVEVACDFAKGISARLAGLPVPVYEDKPQTFEDCQALIAKTLAFVASVEPGQMDAAAERAIVIQAGTPRERHFVGANYLVHYGLPQFLFHITTAYAILRHNGVELGKKDYMGSY
ncbi:MAG: DUF1993 family protein [Burkholderiaceae bacterium]